MKAYLPAFALVLLTLLPAQADDPTPAIQQPSSNIITLTAANATINGSGLTLEGDDEQDLGMWSNAADYPSWVVNVATTGRYRAELSYSGVGDSATSQMELTVGSEKIDFQPFPTGDWTHYRRVKLGEINLSDKGHVVVALKCVKKGGTFVMNLRKVILIPVDSPSTADDMVPTLATAQGQVITLTPAIASITGSSIALGEDGAFGSWSSTDTSFYWPINFQPGHYHVSWTYSLDHSNIGTEIEVTVGNDHKFSVTPNETGDWTQYTTVEIGDFTITKAGPQTLTVKATKMGASFVMNLKQITLTPDK